MAHPVRLDMAVPPPAYPGGEKLIDLISSGAQCEQCYSCKPTAQLEREINLMPALRRCCPSSSSLNLYIYIHLSRVSSATGELKCAPAWDRTRDLRVKRISENHGATQAQRKPIN